MGDMVALQKPMPGRDENCGDGGAESASVLLLTARGERRFRKEIVARTVH